MSRSYRHTPIFGNCLCHSEKQDKRLANRRWRRIVRYVLRTGDSELLPLQREVSNVWSFGKDGKRYFHNPGKWLRK